MAVSTEERSLLLKRCGGAGKANQEDCHFPASYEHMQEGYITQHTGAVTALAERAVAS